MTLIGHLFDGSAGWQQRVGVSQLLDRLPSDRYTQTLATLDPIARQTLQPITRPVEILPNLGGLGALTGLAAARFIRRQRVELVHAWGVRAAAAARTTPDVPLVLQLFDPRIAQTRVRLIRTIARRQRFAVVCSCEIVRRRLIEGGLAPDLAVVIRPAVDFSRLNHYRRSSLRETLGLTRDAYVAIVPEPITRRDGQYDAVLAVVLKNSATRDLRIILPGDSREKRRIARLTGTIPPWDALVIPDHSPVFEHLLAVSDVLLVTPRGDTSTTAIAWAMAAGVAVIGTAVHAVAELIANKVNGLLFKQIPGRSMSPSIVHLLADRAAQKKVIETARGQAYEVFSLRRYAEQYRQLYANVLRGALPGEGITDSAR